MILEKAFAKMMGSYMKMDGNFARVPFRAMTGNRPVEYMWDHGRKEGVCYCYYYYCHCNGYFSILLVSCLLWSGALESSDVHLSCPIISYHITIHHHVNITPQTPFKQY